MATPMHDAVAEREFVVHEHRELLRGFDRLHDVGASVGHHSVGEVSVALHRVILWLEHDLEDHVAWEETWLYPEIDQRTDTPWATRTMRFEHQQIRAAVRGLATEQAALGHELTHPQATELRYRIFGLEGLLRAHMECEDRMLLPILAEG